MPQSSGVAVDGSVPNQVSTAIAHLPMPYARRGSAINTVIRHLSAEHHAHGGASYALLAQSRDATIEGVATLGVDFTRRCPKEYFSRSEYLVDHFNGLVARRRPHVGSLFEEAAEALAVNVIPDVLVVHEGHYGVAALPEFRAVLPSTTGVIYYVHTAVSRAVGRRELRRLLSHADGIVTVSDFMAEHVRHRAGWQRAPIRTVLNGTAPDPLATTRVSMSSEPLRLVFVGQTLPHKGLHLLVQGLARLPRRRRRQVQVRVIGSPVHGPADEIPAYEARLRTMARDVDLDMEFLGFQEPATLALHYRWAHLAVVPSVFQDPCPLVALEALSHGLGVLTTGRGGIAEVVQAAGMTCPATDTGFASALTALLDTPDVVTSLSAAALVRASEITWAGQYRLFRDAVGLGV